MLGFDTSSILPGSIDDKYLLEQGTGIQPEGLPSLLDAFVVTIKIFEVMEGIRKTDYVSFRHSFRLPELIEVLKLNEQIDQIENGLPSHLKRDNSANANTPRDQMLNFQAEAVMTRYVCMYFAKQFTFVTFNLLIWKIASQNPSPPSCPPSAQRIGGCTMFDHVVHPYTTCFAHREHTPDGGVCHLRSIRIFGYSNIACKLEFRVSHSKRECGLHNTFSCDGYHCCITSTGNGRQS